MSVQVPEPIPSQAAIGYLHANVGVAVASTAEDRADVYADVTPEPDYTGSFDNFAGFRFTDPL